MPGERRQKKMRCRRGRVHREVRKEEAGENLVSLRLQHRSVDRTPYLCCAGIIGVLPGCVGSGSTTSCERSRKYLGCRSEKPILDLFIIVFGLVRH